MLLKERPTRQGPKVSRTVTCDSPTGPRFSATKHKLQSTYVSGGCEYALQSTPTRCRALNTAAEADIIESTKEALQSALGLAGWHGKTACPSVAQARHQTTNSESKHMPLPAACTTMDRWSSVDNRDADHVCPRKPSFKSTRPSRRKPESVLAGEDVALALPTQQAGKNCLARANQSGKAAPRNVLRNRHNLTDSVTQYTATTLLAKHDAKAMHTVTLIEDSDDDADLITCAVKSAQVLEKYLAI